MATSDAEPFLGTQPGTAVDSSKSEDGCCGCCRKCCQSCADCYKNSCWCRCCTCFGIFMILFAIWFLLGVPGGRWIPVGPNTVTLGYGADMISLLLSKGIPGYPDAWCGGNSVDDLASCRIKANFPGPDTTSYMAWDDVWKIGSQYPSKEWSGEWWRGNELGFIINNPKFWSNAGIDPLSILLGSTPGEHAAVRPLLEDMWGLKRQDDSDAAAEAIRRRIRNFFKERTTFTVPTDVTILVHQILNEVGLKRNVSWEYSQAFVSVQTTVVAMATVSQLIPGVLAGITLGSISASVVDYIREYTPLLQELYGEQLALEDCAPSKNCTVQLAAATWDALYAAGGLSVPGTISTGLGVLYSTSGSNPAPGVTYAKDEAAQFYWENIRYFPPVVGFPHWSTRPTCAGSSAEDTAKLNKPNGKTQACALGEASFFTGYPTVNQYVGGVRAVPNLAIAMWDPRKWGDDSNEFVLRPLAEYDKYSVGFAEMAVNNSVAEGRMNRDCPGKSLALMIGTMFFEEFDQSLWKTTDSISWKSTTPFVGTFTLSSGASMLRWSGLLLLFVLV